MIRGKGMKEMTLGSRDRLCTTLEAENCLDG